MALLSLSLPTGVSGITPVDNSFINDFMTGANGEFIKVYLYALCQCYLGNSDLSSEVIARHLDMLESDVLKAWKYWDKVGVITLTKPSQAGNVYSIQFQCPSKMGEKNQNIALPKKRNKKPVYSPEEISLYIKNSEEIKLLFRIAEEKLARPLSYNDTNTIFSFYDWLRLPIEAIIMLLEYCVQIGKRDIRYIEKVAVEWSDKGINTVDKIEQHIKEFEDSKGHYKEIMNSLGFYRNPSKYEKEYMDKWLQTWSLPMEVVLKACEMTINIPEPSFPYMDTILEYWKREGVKTLADCDKAIAKFRDGYKTNKLHKQPGGTKNKFHNFPQRNYDFNDLEQKILEKNIKEFGGM
jgi:DnaD/phage-associated family protein